MRIALLILALLELFAGSPASAVEPELPLILPGAIATPDNQLPGQEEWRTFAKPLAIGTSNMLLFQRSGAERDSLYGSPDS